MKKSRKSSNRKPESSGVRNTILVTRISSPRQAENDEGSIKNQLQRLRGYIDYHRNCGEDWPEMDHIELKAISGKVSVRSPEFQPLLDHVMLVIP